MNRTCAVAVLGVAAASYSVFHCLTISTFLLALVLFSSADKWGLTWVPGGRMCFDISEMFL